MAYNIVGNGYNYLGVTAITPPNLQINPNAPTINNMNANIGDFWLQKDTTNLWFLTSLENQQAIWTPVGGGGGGTITAVNGGDNINVNTVAGVATVNLNKSISQPNTNSSGTEGLYSLGGDRFLHNKGLFCTYIGNDSGNLSNGGSSNVGIGQNSLYSISGSNNVAVGAYSSSNLTSGSYSVIIGSNSGALLTSQDRNVAIGYNAINFASNFLAEDNVVIGSNVLEQASYPSATIAIGSGCLKRASTSSGNTCVGHSVADSLQTGNNNIILGSISGQNLASNESNNIIISNFGEIDDQNTIRIGTEGSGSHQQNTTYIAGIYNNSVDGGTQQTVIIDSTGKLGSMVGGGGGGISAVNGGDNINVNTVAGVATVNLNKSISQPVTNTSGTEGVYSLGFSRFMHNYGTNNTFVGSVSGNLTLTGEANSCFGTSSGNGLNSGKNNSFFGYQSGTRTTSGKYNSYFGLTAGAGNYIGNYNCAFGATALAAAETSDYNVALGYGSLIGIVSGASNIAIGARSGGQLTSSASNNILIGDDGGFGLTGTESNNIIIGNQGLVGDNNTIRIGDQGSGDFQQNNTYIAGIYNNTVDGGTQQFVIIDSTGKLGSAVGGGGGGSVNTLSGDTGTPASPTGGNIEIAGGLNINTSSTASTVTVNLNDSISLPDTNGAGTQGVYSLGGNRFLHNYGTSNLFLGALAGNLSLTGDSNTALGALALTNATTALRNVAVGLGSLQSATTSRYNTCVGFYSGQQLLTGLGNVLLGINAGALYTTNESSNVIINNLGVTGENHVIRIGTDGNGDGEQNKAYMAGIYNRSVNAGTQQTVIIDSTGKLGSAVGEVITGGCRVFTGVAVNGSTAPVYYDCSISAKTTDATPLTIFTFPYVGSYTVFIADVTAGGYPIAASTPRAARVASFTTNSAGTSAYNSSSGSEIGGAAIDVTYSNCDITVTGANATTMYWAAQIKLTVVPV